MRVHERCFGVVNRMIGKLTHENCTDSSKKDSSYFENLEILMMVTIIMCLRVVW
jgi:hypothetical protein